MVERQLSGRLSIIYTCIIILLHSIAVVSLNGQYGCSELHQLTPRWGYLNRGHYNYRRKSLVFVHLQTCLRMYKHVHIELSDFTKLQFVSIF